MQIMSLVGCTEEEARKAFDDHKDVVLAVDSLMVVPSIPGQKYIPEKPKINRMMSDEQAARCDRGRKVCDSINAVRKSAFRSAKEQAESVSTEQPEDLPALEDETVHSEPIQ